MNTPSINLKSIQLGVKSVTLTFADESKLQCLYEGSYKCNGYEALRFRCENAFVDIFLRVNGESCLLGFSIASLKALSSIFPLEMELDIKKPKRILVLTTHKDAAKPYSNAFGYYNQFAIGKEPRSPKPSEEPEYPPQMVFIEHSDYARGYPCWTYPTFSDDFGQIPYYSVFLLADYDGAYMALFTFTDRYATIYIEPGPKLRVFLGKSEKNVELNWAASITVDNNPYKAVEHCVNAASLHLTFKPRWKKKAPDFMNKIGWCSWNALLTEDLSYENVIEIVKRILDRGLRLGWIIIDDGWQDEIKRDGWPRRILRRLSANERFPGGIINVSRRLRELGVGLVGLWHTINIHWSGFDRDVSKELGVAGYFSKFNESYVPPPRMDEAYEFYRRFHSWVKANGIDFVKIDNQWVIHALYNEDSTVGESSRSIELAMQAAAYSNGLDIINCMSMAPENYSNFLFSNIMRVSIDYIPFWKADAKLHTIFSVYNALLFSHIAYPDYDMFMSYDPYALVHAVARVFSGGPIYITDREPEKTNIELLKRFVLPDGRLIKAYEPAIPTKDVLFRDPYNEPILLKIASKVGDCIAVAIFNVNRHGGRITDSIALDMLPFEVNSGEYAYYKVFANECGTIKECDRLSISLDELGVEVMVLSPIKDGKAVIGLREYILPPSPIRVLRTADGKVLVESIAHGTLLYYADGKFNEREVEKESIIEIL
ncbi:MAG: Sip1-related alpha-galactosidase [Candidatus Bathyarchaeia archaeon]